MQRLDDTFHALVGLADAPLQAYAATLPFQLGIVDTPQGEWEDFWILDPSRNAPVYANEGAVVDGDALQRFRRAHHCAVMFGLVADRLVDRQTAPDVRLDALLSTFYAAWRAALGVACGDQSLADGAVDAAMTAWREGTALEQHTLATRDLTLQRYALQTVGKLRWGSTASLCLLAHSGSQRRLACFQRSFDLFCLSIQCTDDAIDSDEDKALHGVSIADLLGVSPGALAKAAIPLAEEARQEAHAGEFHELGRWLTRWRTFLENSRPDGDPVANLADGLRLGQALTKEL